MSSSNINGVQKPNSSQKFIARNRAPRVQIEYDVEVYGSEKKVELPFVMGVLADLSGKPVEPLQPVADRRFLDIDIENFDERMKAIKPRVAFAVQNTLTGEGHLMVDMTFEKMDDFSPAAVARKVEPLRRLLDARTQLANLQTYMDGKSGAETLINKLLADPALLKSLAETPKPLSDDHVAEGEARQ
ncbi:type VI secretion system contractile sheath small subunit [Caballeronia ptereochthonis]|uniref:Type VI secretion protein n=1 Tax=Caballeronia ptereochthonis TaxID=1777144 RepID=A0A158A8L8_9BURK|nr:type VI secretion system contractile sheath small subunit [Caballeronia ptereochthonis]SAK54174.1 type VI secretion protein [Caballeronia ptereochthonis]